MYQPHIDCKKKPIYRLGELRLLWAEYACAQADLIVCGLPVPKTSFCYVVQLI